MKWRTGCEGRISHLKRNYGWDRTMIDTTEGARTWTGHGVFTHNLTKIATLTARTDPDGALTAAAGVGRIRPNPPIPTNPSSSGRSS